MRELSPSYFNPLGRDNAENRDELVQVMIAKFNNSSMPNFYGYFVDAQKYIMSPKKANESFLAHNERINKELFEEINHFVEISPDNRLQIIVRTGPHYLTLDIDKERKSCFILDAAGDIRQERFFPISAFIQDIERVTYVKTENVPHPDDSTRTIRTLLQCDSHSCSIFALDHAKQIASLETIHEQIKETSSGEDDTIHFIKWTDLPPEMVKNAQSTSVLKWYNETNAECAEKSNALTGNNKKNHGFEETRKYITQEAHKLCDEKSESDIKAMIESTEIKEGQSQLTFSSSGARTE